MTPDLLKKGVEHLPLSWVRPLSGVSLVVPYYHMVSGDYVPHVSPLYRFRTVTEFTSDLEFFLSRFQPVTLKEIVQALDEGRTFTRPSFHVTFDDGFREMYDIVVPILERLGVPATFFLNTAFLDGGGLAHHNVLSLALDLLQSSSLSRESRQHLESILPAMPAGTDLEARILAISFGDNVTVRNVMEALEIDIAQYVSKAQPYLSSEQVRSMISRGFSIGAHSHDHPHYANLSLAEQITQTRTSMNFLSQKYDVNPRAFAFPHNDSGVGAEFFKEVFAGHLLDVSFGTGGLVSHFHPRNIERVSMEKTSVPAERILARQFVRATFFRLRSPSVK